LTEVSGALALLWTILSLRLKTSQISSLIPARQGLSQSAPPLGPEDQAIDVSGLVMMQNEKARLSNCVQSNKRQFERIRDGRELSIVLLGFALL
jgi:hypothetical protein